MRECRVACSSKLTHLAKPAKRHSHSTSCGGGVSPTVARAPGNSSMVEATARAVVHARMEHHKRRHACSIRRRINCQLGDECLRLSTNIHPLRAPGQQSELCGGVPPIQGRSSLSLACCVGGHSILLSSPPPGRAVGPQCTDQCCVSIAAGLLKKKKRPTRPRPLQASWRRQREVRHGRGP